ITSGTFSSALRPDCELWSVQWLAGTLSISGQCLAVVLSISLMPRGKTGREPKARMDAYEAVFTALAHPARRRILLTLNFEGGSMTAGEIADVFEHAWPTTTRHIQVLESAGLLCHDQQG